MDDIWETVSRRSTRPGTPSEAVQEAQQPQQDTTARGSPSPPRNRAAAPFEPSSR